MHNISTGQQDRYHNHAQAWELLPWYINGTLSAEEEQQILEHMTVCLVCRKELGLQSALRDSVKNLELDEVIVTASFERLSAKLHNQDPGPKKNSPEDVQSGLRKFFGKFTGALNLWSQQKFKPGYVVAAMLALAIVVILPGSTANLLVGNNTFKTLSNAVTESPAAADLRLIFIESVSDSERDAILDSAGLSIVSGPDERGLYFLNTENDSAGALEATLRQLHDNDRILFAEFAIGTASNSQLPGER